MAPKFRSTAHLASLLFLIHLPKGHAEGAPAPLENVSEVAEIAIAKHTAPGLAVAAVVDGEIRAAGFAGVRKQGDPSVGNIGPGDRFHLGSLTKSFTATLAATMVEEGRIRWASTPAEILRPTKIHPGFHGLTLEHLLSNCGGFPADVPGPIWKNAWSARGNFEEIRLKFAADMLAREPLFPPGSAYLYSNTGFSIAGVLLESRVPDSWESLIRKRIFEPLEMGSSGFRAPAADPADPTALRPQPWGHRPGGGPVPPEPFGDNPFAIAPAGAIHSSILDLAKYARFHLLKIPAPVLKNPKSFDALHSPRRNGYALGWTVANRPWADGEILTHTGSNTMFFATLWIVPKMNFAAVAAANIGGDSGANACEDAIGAMLDRYIRNKTKD